MLVQTSLFTNLKFYKKSFKAIIKRWSNSINVLPVYLGGGFAWVGNLGKSFRSKKADLHYLASDYYATQKLRQLSLVQVHTVDGDLKAEFARESCQK